MSVKLNVVVREDRIPMLRELHIENLALIDSLHLDFSKELSAGESSGLIVLTGETGSGKSIILQALHLLTGGRGSASWIRSDCDRAEIEALFEVDPDHQDILQRLQEQDLDNDGTIIIRRVFLQTGRSRFYINSRLATARLASELTQNLINIAGQHEHQQLLVPRRHLDFIDSIGELWDQRREFTSLYNHWQSLTRQIKDLQRQEQDKEQRRDFLQFQIREIREVDIQPKEDGSLVERRDKLKSADILITLARKSSDILYGSIIDKLVEVRKNFEQAEVYDPSIKEITQRTSSLCFEVEDLADSVRNYRDGLPVDTGMLDEINSRLTQLKQLQRKYGVTLEEVIGFVEQAENELASLETMEEKLTELKVQAESLEKKLLDKADKLSGRRREVAETLVRSLQKELRSLQFSQVLFEVVFVESEEHGVAGLHSTGKDQVEFFFSANPGEPVKPLAKVVSGGELSRLMLAMKCLLARRDQVDTVIFDEVDAGIGGKAAEAVAEKIRELAGHHQVFCITHLPQIAAFADEHYRVGKVVESGRTRTTITSLDTEERVDELAGMLAGDSVTNQTKAYARELIESKV